MLKIEPKPPYRHNCRPNDRLQPHTNKPRPIDLQFANREFIQIIYCLYAI